MENLFILLNVKKSTCHRVKFFFCSHFVNNLLSKGFTVHGTSRSKEPHKVYLPYKYNKNIEKFNYFKCDLNKNLDNLINFIKKEKPQYIVNYSAQGMVAQSWDAPLDWFKTNVVSQIELQDQLRKFKFLKNTFISVHRRFMEILIDG